MRTPKPGWTLEEHKTELQRSKDNLRRAIAAECAEAAEFEAGQVAAHERAISQIRTTPRVPA